MIEVKDLWKTFKISKKQRKSMGPDFIGNSVDAVAGVSFKCEPGRIYALLGPNGAGKTTTLRMISTIFKPTRGSIEVCGYDAVKDPEEVRRNIGFLTGSTGLYERLTPNELVDYFGKLFQVDKANLKRKKDELFTLLDVHEFANKRIAKLSTGMKQKVSIVRTIIHDPPVVVFDEPTSGLDVIAGKAIIQLIQDCRSQGKSVIFSTHIMNEVEILCDDLGIIHKGKMQYEGSFEDFQSNMATESLVDEFIHVVNQAS